MADSIEKTPREIGEKEKGILDGFIKYKTHRQKVWDPIAAKCEKFVYGDQWSTEHKTKLKKEGRAPSVFNQVLPAIDAISGHHIRNTVDLVAKPVDKHGDIILADILTTVIKNVEWQNGVTSERRFQVFDGLTTGIGVKEIWLENDLELQNVIRVAQDSPWHWYFDPRMQKYDLRDCKKIYKEVWMSLEEIRTIYGDEVADKLHMPESENDLSNMPEYSVKPSWDSNSTDYGNSRFDGVNDYDFNQKLLQGGYDPEQGLFRVLEEYEKKYDRIELYWDDIQKRVISVDELPKEVRKELKGRTKSMRKGYIKLTTLIADSVIAQETDIRSKKNEDVEFYDLINVYFAYWMNGKYFGAVENLLYPQEDVNKHFSQILNILNSYANSGLDYEESALVNPEDEARLPDLLAQTGAARKWADGALTGGKVRPIQPHEAPQTLFTLVGLKEEAIRYISSTPQSFQGNSQRGESGRARQSDIDQASMKQLGLIENFRETQRLEGKAYLYWIQNYYNSEMLLRIVGDEYEKNSQEVMINMQYYDKIINDVSIGRYDITLEHEARTQSERERNRFMLIELSNTVPQYADLIAEEVLMLSDVPQKDKLLAKWQQRQQLIQQQMMMGGQPAQNTARGPIQSAPRPERGPRRMPQVMGG